MVTRGTKSLINKDAPNLLWAPQVTTGCSVSPTAIFYFAVAVVLGPLLDLRLGSSLFDRELNLENGFETTQNDV